MRKINNNNSCTFSIAALFLKTWDAGTDCMNDKKKSILDSTPTVLVEHFTMYDDKKNNNQESTNVLKERHHQAAKPSTENDVNNCAKSVDHASFKCGKSLTIADAIKHADSLSTFPPKNPGKEIGRWY